MDPFEQVRRHGLAMEGVSEKLSHGSPSFFARDTASKAGRCFVMCHDDHHGDGVVGLWFAAPPGAQEAALAQNSDVFYRRRTSGTAAGSACDWTGHCHRRS